MPEKFPLEYYCRTHHPDAWFEYWQENHYWDPELREEPLADTSTQDTMAQEEHEEIWPYLGWPDSNYYG